jgi:hypothetical protein
MSGYPDSNGGPPAPEAGALSQLRHIPKLLLAEQIKCSLRSKLAPLAECGCKYKNYLQNFLSNALFNCPIASSTVALGQPMLSLINPSPPGPNTAPSFRAR